METERVKDGPSWAAQPWSYSCRQEHFTGQPNSSCFTFATLPSRHRHVRKKAQVCDVVPVDEVVVSAAVVDGFSVRVEPAVDCVVGTVVVAAVRVVVVASGVVACVAVFVVVVVLTFDVEVFVVVVVLAVVVEAACAPVVVSRVVPRVVSSGVVRFVDDMAVVALVVPMVVAVMPNTRSSSRATRGMSLLNLLSTTSTCAGAWKTERPVSRRITGRL